jgi:hypothetical protein
VERFSLTKVMMLLLQVVLKCSNLKMLASEQNVDCFIPL